MGIKTCEIRPWAWQVSAYPYPLTLAMHTSQDDSNLAEDIDEVSNRFHEAYYALNNDACQPCVPGFDYFYSQAIVGLVDVVGCMLIDPKWNDKEREKQIVDAGYVGKYAEWAMAPYSFFLANPRRFKTGIQCPGQLKIWKVSPIVQRHIEANQTNLITRRTYIKDVEPLTEIMPTVPVGIVKCLGKPNYSELDRKTKAKIAKAKS